MSEALDFSLRLVDGASGPAKKIADSLKQVQGSADKAQAALNKGLGKQFERIGFAAARAAKKQQDAFAASFAKIGFAAARLKKREHEKAERTKEKAEDKALMTGVKEALGFHRLASAAFIGSALAEGVVKVGESLVEAANRSVEIIVDGVKDAFASAAKEQTLRVGEKNALGTDGANGFREDAEKFAKLTPFNDSEIRAMMLPLRRAGLSQAASRQAFATATDIGGGDQGAVGGILEQFKRIYTKQGVGKKQLVELLGNVGETIPQFYKELGKKMKVSAKVAEKKAANGAVDPQLLMNMITAAQNTKQGGAAGTGGKNFADTFEVRWKKIKELPDEFFKKFVGSPSFDRANAALGQFLEQMSPDSPAGQRIMASLNRMFDRIGGLLSNPEELVDSITDGIENAIGLFEQILPTVRNLGAELAVAADWMSQIVSGARVYYALASGNKEEATRIIDEQRAAKVERLAERFKQQNEAAGKKKVRDDVAFNLLGGGIPGIVTGNGRVGNVPGGGKVIHLHVHPGAVQVHPPAGEGHSHAHHEAGEKLKRHVQGALEQAAQEAGG